MLSMVKFHLILFSHFREDFWRVFVLFNMKLPNHVTDYVIKKILLTNLSQDDPQKFAYWSDVAFYVSNYDVIKKAPITSNKNHTYCSCELIAMWQVSIFPMVWFRRYRGPKFFLFSNMAATLHDLRCHNYHENILHEYLLLWWKFCVNLTSGCSKTVFTFCAAKQTNRQTDNHTQMQYPLLWQG